MLNARAKVLGVKIEATSGTEATLSAGDYDVLIYEASFTPQPEILQRQPQLAHDGQVAAVIGGQLGQVTLRTELKGAGGSDPIWTRLLQACRFTSATGGLHPSSNLATAKTVTLHYYHAGILKKLIGATGTVIFRLAAGQIAWAEWTFTGVALAWTDAALPSPDYESTKPLIVSCASFTLGGVTPIVNELVIDIGATVSPRRSIAACNGGIIHTLVASRAPTITLDPEAVLTATRNVYGQITSSTELALSVTLNGGTGNTVEITAPKVQFTGLSEAEREGVAVDSITGQLNADTGDDWLNVEIT